MFAAVDAPVSWLSNNAAGIHAPPVNWLIQMLVMFAVPPACSQTTKLSPALETATAGRRSLASSPARIDLNGGPGR